MTVIERGPGEFWQNANIAWWWWEPGANSTRVRIAEAGAERQVSVRDVAFTPVPISMKK